MVRALLVFISDRLVQVPREHCLFYQQRRKQSDRESVSSMSSKKGHCGEQQGVCVQHDGACPSPATLLEVASPISFGAAKLFYIAHDIASFRSMRPVQSSRVTAFETVRLLHFAVVVLEVPPGVRQGCTNTGDEV